jgi:protein associated with RNAse G/E
MRIHVGHTLTVRVLHADGQCFRSWQSIVEQVMEDGLVTLSTPGHAVEDIKGNWILQNYIRNFYWFDHMYNLLEVYEPDGTFSELYINVASVPTLSGNILTWTDYELDVSMLAGQTARIVDQDEFDAAIFKYGYTPEFQARCHIVSQEALALAKNWKLSGLRNKSA